MTAAQEFVPLPSFLGWDNRLLFTRKRRIKRYRRWRKIGLADELDRFFRAVFPIHARIFPLNRERAVVADPVKDADDRFEVHVAAPNRDEVPAAPRITKVEVRSEDAVTPV